MQKIIKEIVQKDDKKFIQVTIADERWYIKSNDIEGKPEQKPVFVPSVTWICSYWYKDPYLVKWIADQGWDEAEMIKKAAGSKGSKVHAAIVNLLDGDAVLMGDEYKNPDTAALEELTLEEYTAIMSFANWFNEVKPTIIDREFVVWGEGYAGTIDLLCEIDGQKWIIDFKTSKSIFDEHKLQVAAYKYAYGSPTDAIKIAILQVGYSQNKKGFKFTEIENPETHFEDFKSAQYIWARKNANVQPKVKDYPEQLKLDITKVEK